MKKHICAIRDRQMDAFMQPFFIPALGLAIRSFQDEIKNPEGQMNKHPEDYELYHLGNFDEETGQFENLVPKPKQIAIGEHFNDKE